MPVRIRENATCVEPPPRERLGEGARLTLLQVGLFASTRQLSKLMRVAVLLVAAGGIWTMSAVAPRGHSPVAVVFGPWSNAQDATDRIRRAGGVAIEPGSGAHWLVSAFGGSVAIGGGAEFRRALRAEGAWMVVDAQL